MSGRYGDQSPYAHYTRLKEEKDLEWDIRHAAKKKAKAKAKKEEIARRTREEGPNFWVRDAVLGLLAGGILGLLVLTG